MFSKKFKSFFHPLSLSFPPLEHHAVYSYHYGWKQEGRLADRSLKILGTGSYLPERVVTNAELEGIVSNFDPELAGKPFATWAEDVTGIRERRFVAEETSEIMAREASLRAIEAAGLAPGDIQFIIACTFTPSVLIPNMACTVGDMIGAGRAGGFALNTACGGFLYGLSMAYSLIVSGVYDTVLIVASEILSKTIGFDDPKTAILFGDGAAAVVAGAGDGGGMCSPPSMSAEFSEHIKFYNAGTRNVVEKMYIEMPGGPRVLRRAIHLMAEAAEEVLDARGWNLSEIDCMIPHQANSRITWGLVDRMNMDRGKVLNTITCHGNTSGASIPLALDAAVRGLPEAGGISISRGDKLLMTAVGGGYSIAAAVLEY